MAVIKKTNVLNLGPIKQSKIWDMLRNEPAMQTKITAADLNVPLLGFLRWSVSAHGVVVFLIGEDPAKI